MKELVRNILALFDLDVRRKSCFDAYFADVVRKETWKQDIAFTHELSKFFGDQYLELIEKSKSQLRQDLFVLMELGFKRNGFFVEFGATDGITLSNTYLLEKEFGYKGILAEPSPSQRKRISTIREVPVEQRCVWRESGARLEFVDVGDLSTIKDFSANDLHKESRNGRRTFKVETISLKDMLTKYDAPNLIDYLSIDTEGSEFDILSAHDFSRYRFSVITVEHNYTEQREKINELLTRNGYVRKFEHLSKFDDWYVLKSS